MMNPMRPTIRPRRNWHNISVAVSRSKTNNVMVKMAIMKAMPTRMLTSQFVFVGAGSSFMAVLPVNCK